MIVVCNSTILITLARIGKLNILKNLLKEIYIPDAVYKEVVIDGKGLPGAEEVEKAEWIRNISIKDKLASKILKKDLGEKVNQKQ